MDGRRRFGLRGGRGAGSVARARARLALRIASAPYVKVVRCVMACGRMVLHACYVSVEQCLVLSVTTWNQDTLTAWDIVIGVTTIILVGALAGTCPWELVVKRMDVLCCLTLTYTHVVYDTKAKLIMYMAFFVRQGTC